MKRTPEQSALDAAWLNILDHCEAQLQSLGALPEGRSELREAREQIKVMAARKERGVLRARESRKEIMRLHGEVKRLSDAAHHAHGLAKLSEERRLELLALAQLLGCDCVPHKMLEAVKALQVAASAEGNECIRVRLPRNGGPQISIDGETWYDQKTWRKV